jgi:hypothetical protein
MSAEPVAVPALPLDIILPRLERFCFSRQVCRFLQGDPDFQALAVRCHQIAFVMDIAESRYNKSLTINALMRAFDCA